MLLEHSLLLSDHKYIWPSVEQKGEHVSSFWVREFPVKGFQHLSSLSVQSCSHICLCLRPWDVQNNGAPRAVWAGDRRCLFSDWQQIFDFDFLPKDISPSLAASKVWAIPNTSPSISDTPHSTHSRDLLADTTQGRPIQVNKNQIPPPWLHHSHCLVFQLGCHGWWVCRITADSISRALFQAGTPVLEVVGLSFPFSQQLNLDPICLPVFLHSSLKGTFLKRPQSQEHRWKVLLVRNTLLLPLSGFLLRRLCASALKS